MLRKLALAVAASTVMMNSAFALGLGDIRLESALNQPLNARIELLDAQSLRPEDISVRLANPADFERAGIARELFLSNIRFQVIVGNDGQPSLRLRTNQAVVEPFLNFLVEVNWPSGRLLREYTVLIDPVDVPSRVAPVAVETAPVSSLASRLEPAPQPRQAPARAASRSESLPAGQVRIANNDTLFEIARDHRPSSDISINQMMLAILAQNPDAFLRGNINLIKSGSLLTMPTAEQARALTAAQANARVQEHHQAFRAGVPVRSAAQVAPGSATAPSAPAERTVASGELSIVADSGTGSATGTNADVQSLRNQLTLSGEQTDQLRRDNELLNEKVRELEQQLQIMQRMVDLRSESGAALQQALAQADAATTAEPTSGLDADSEAALAADDQSASEQAPASAADAAAAAATAVPSPTPAVVPVQPPQIQQPTGFFDRWLAPVVGFVTASVTNIILVSAGVVLLILALLLMVGRRSKEEELPDDLDELEPLEQDEVLSPDFDSAEEADDLAGESEQYFSQDEDEDGPLSNADMYLAYGHYEQALAELDQAEAKGVEAERVAEKRLEVYAESGRRDDFETLVKTSAALLSAATISALREKLLQNAEENLDDSDELDLNAELQSDDHSGSETTDGSSVADEDFSLDLDLDLDSGLDEQALTAPSSGAKTTNDDMSLDFDLSAFDAEPAANTSESKPEKGQSLESVVDFDLSGFDSEPESRSKADDVSIEPPLDFDFEAKDFNAEAEVDASKDRAQDAADSGAADLDFDLDTDLTFDEPSELANELPEDESPAVIDLELDDVADLEDIGLAGDAATDAEADDDFGILSSSDEIATKLDLAQAYIDMEDAEAARDLLEEVLAEGNSQQQAKAQEILDSL